MDWLNNLKVSHKLTLLIAISIIALVLSGSIGYYGLNKNNNALKKMYNEKLIAVQLLNENRAYARHIQSVMFEFMLTDDPELNKTLSADIQDKKQRFDENLTKYRQLPLSTQEKSKLQQLDNAIEKYRAVQKDIFALAAENKNTEAYNLFNTQGKILSKEFTNGLTELSQASNEAANKMSEDSQKEFTFLVTVFVIIILFFSIFSLLLGIIMIKQISGRIQDFITFIAFLSDGDFSHQVPEKSLQDRSEFGSLSRAIDKMNKNTKDLISHISQTSDHLASASEELTASAEQSSQAATQVANSITEVANGAEKQLELTNNADILVNQISDAIKQVATNTQTVSAFADKTAIAANDGDTSLKQAVTQIQTIENTTNHTATVISELAETSQEISQIVDAISNIAGQTNLLALNAAIEAARAGEAGKGFAVVAEEVRKLAEQSQESAKQIIELITKIQNRTSNAVEYMNNSKQEVTAGAAIISHAGENFNQILTMITKMTDQIRETSSSVQEITSHTENIVNAVRHIDDESKHTSEETQTISAATEEQSASMGEIASASRHLAEMAEGLQNMINKFRT